MLLEEAPRLPTVQIAFEDSEQGEVQTADYDLANHPYEEQVFKVITLDTCSSVSSQLT